MHDRKQVRTLEVDCESQAQSQVLAWQGDPVRSISTEGKTCGSYEYKGYYYSNSSLEEILRHGLLVCGGYHNKMPQTGWSKQQKFILSQFRRLKLQDQGIGRLCFS